MKIYFFKEHQFHFDTESNQIVCPRQNVMFNKKFEVIHKSDFLRFLHCKYSNKDRFMSNFIEPIRNGVGNLELLDYLEAEYENVPAFSYTEAFSIPNLIFQSIVFGNIRVAEMIAELGHTRIATEGLPVKHKQYSKAGEFLGYHEYHVIFETHAVSGSKLGLRDNIYAVRCWCTTTNNEHWLWIDEKYKDDPLEAIAHTFFIHENLIPHIKGLKRQGDILLVELTGDIEPRGNMVSLSKDQYFSLLTAQS